MLLLSPVSLFATLFFKTASRARKLRIGFFCGNDPINCVDLLGLLTQGARDTVNQSLSVGVAVQSVIQGFDIATQNPNPPNSAEYYAWRYSQYLRNGHEKDCDLAAAEHYLYAYYSVIAGGLPQAFTVTVETPVYDTIKTWMAESGILPETWSYPGWGQQAAAYQGIDQGLTDGGWVNNGGPSEEDTLYALASAQNLQP